MNMSEVNEKMISMTSTGTHAINVCAECGFDLWLPIGTFRQSALGLYDDARFKGRSILALDGHYEHYEDVPAAVLRRFTEDTRLAVGVIKEATGVDRVNVAILGNRDSHVHAHLIPRYPADEQRPDSSPWDDPRPKAAMAAAERDELLLRLREAAADSARTKWWSIRRSANRTAPQRAAGSLALFDSELALP